MPKKQTLLNFCSKVQLALGNEDAEDPGYQILPEILLVLLWSLQTEPEVGALKIAIR